MFDKTRPMDLGDIFSNTFKLFTKTFSRNIVIATAFLIPVGIIMAYGLDSFFSGMMKFTRNVAENNYLETDPKMMFDLFSNIGMYSFSLVVFSIGYLCAMIGITKVSGSAMNNEQIGLGEAFNKIFSITFWRCLGQAALLYLALTASIFAGIALTIIGASTHLVFLIIIGALGLIAGILIMIYLIFRWYFAFVAIVCDDKEIIASFSKSSFLVEGNWWRTFGIIILISVLVDFAVSIISTPLSFIFMWDFISEYFKMITRGGIHQNDPEVIFRMMESLGFAFGAIIIITTILDALITPLFNVVLYYDLRIRKNDFTDIPSENNLITGDTSS